MSDDWCKKIYMLFKFRTRVRADRPERGRINYENRDAMFIKNILNPFGFHIDDERVLANNEYHEFLVHRIREDRYMIYTYIVSLYYLRMQFILMKNLNFYPQSF